jgi:preprotein translocase subunit SecA
LFGRADRLDRLLLRGLHFALVDEADSVLNRRSAHAADHRGRGGRRKDEALYRAAMQIADDLEKDVDYRLDPHERSAVLTDQGRVRLKELSRAAPAGVALGARA